MQQARPGARPGTHRPPPTPTPRRPPQTLFTLVNLDIADHLARAGPRTAAQLAALSGAANAAWLERLLAFACHLGLLRRTRRPVAPVLDMRADSRLQIRAGSPDSQRRGDQDPATATATSPAKPQAGKAAAGQPAYEYVYHLTTVSEVLCTDHPCSVAAFVRLQQDHAKPMMACLTQVSPRPAGTPAAPAAPPLPAAGAAATD
jgi:hypothetical protein